LYFIHPIQVGREDLLLNNPSGIHAPLENTSEIALPRKVEKKKRYVANFHSYFVIKGMLPCLTSRITGARCWWLTPVILATWGGRDQEDHSPRPAQSQKHSTQNRVGKWLKW
jgi:hypothetical protein